MILKPAPLPADGLVKEAIMDYDATTEEILRATEEAVNSSKARIERSLRWLARLRGLEFEDRAAALSEWVASEEAIADE